MIFLFYCLIFSTLSAHLIDAANAIQCYSCSSDTQQNCATFRSTEDNELSSKIELKTCNQHTDECFTHVSDGGVVTRGCLSEFESETWNCTDKLTCVRCASRDGCNDIPIETESCISCDSNDNPNCKSNAKADNSVICPQKTIKPQGCYHFISETDERTRRGCVTSLSSEERRLASEQPNQWKYCHGSENCNSRNTFTKCYRCNSTGDPDCISNPSLIPSSVKLCNDYDDSCFTHIGWTAVFRGCLSDLASESIKRCRASPEKCDICKDETGQICNGKKFSEAKCISCDSKKDKRCRTEPELLSQKLCVSADSPDENLGCYLIHTSTDRVKRGCVSDLPVKYRQNCGNESDECKTCKGDNCNKKVEFQYCFECLNKFEPDCVDSHPPDAYTICPNYMDQCLSAIDFEGYTVRRCFSNDSDDNEQALVGQFAMYEVCEDSDCNGNLYPEDRILCIQCDGEPSCNSLMISQNETLEELPCKLYSKYDACFMFLSGDQNMHRGCISDSKDSRLLCELGMGRCGVCSEDGCNDRPLFVEPKLSCYKCDDSTDCAYGQTGKEKIVNCTSPVEFGSQETCYTRSHTDGTIERGCTLDSNNGSVDPNWCYDSEDCGECPDDACNNENVYFGYCLQCDSLSDQDCANPLFGSDEYQVQCLSIRHNEVQQHNTTDDGHNQNDTHTHTHTVKPYPFSQRGCYSLQQDGVIERGCVSSMVGREQRDCNNATWCNICETDYCNDMLFKKSRENSANIQILSYNSFMALSILAVFYF